jgi:cyclic pyranopterin phosphate synthase
VELTHLDAHGRVHMVDVGGKPDTERVAVARGQVEMGPETLRLIADGKVPKGDALTCAQIAGIMAAKRVPELIPLCHPLLLSQVTVDLVVDEAEACVQITASVRTRGKTGAEMEALIAVSVAALTLYDMVKAVEKSARITNVRLISKRGGKSGDVILETDE